MFSSMPPSFTPKGLINLEMLSALSLLVTKNSGCKKIQQQAQPRYRRTSSEEEKNHPLLLLTRIGGVTPFIGITLLQKEQLVQLRVKLLAPNDIAARTHRHNGVVRSADEEHTAAVVHGPCGKNLAIPATGASHKIRKDSVPHNTHACQTCALKESGGVLPGHRLHTAPGIIEDTTESDAVNTAVLRPLRLFMCYMLRCCCWLHRHCRHALSLKSNMTPRHSE